MEMLIKNFAGGLSAWEALSVGERHTRSQVALQTLHHQIGEQRFASLSDAEKGATDFFVWAGCCMHNTLGISRFSGHL